MHRWTTMSTALTLAAVTGSLACQAAAQAAPAPQWEWQTAPKYPSASSPAFIDVAPGSTVTRTFRLTNIGGSATSAIKVSLNTTSTPFRISRDGCTATSLGKRKTCAIDVTYAPTTAGSSTVALTATAKKPATAATLILTGMSNRAPVAVDDSFVVGEDSVFLGEDADFPYYFPAPGVLSNDIDADGDPLTADSGRVTARGGSISLEAPGGFYYRPSGPSFSGVDSFTYKASDGWAESNVATVFITVPPANDIPVEVGE